MKIAGIIILVIIGLAFMGFITEKNPEKKKEFNREAKIGMVIVALISIALIYYGGKKTTAVAIDTKVEKETKLSTESEKTTDDKQIAEDVFTQFTLAKNSFDVILNFYKDEMEKLEDGSVDTTTAYDNFNKLNDKALIMFSNVQSIKVPDKYKEDKETLVMGASYLKDSIKHSRDYLNDKKTKTSAEAKEDLQQALKYYDTSLASIEKKVTAAGYEIPKK